MESPNILETILQHLSQPERAKCSIINKGWRAQAQDSFYVDQLIIFEHKLKKYEAWLNKIGPLTQLRKVCFIGSFDYFVAVCKAHVDPNSEITSFRNWLSWMTTNGMHLENVQELCIYHADILDFEILHRVCPHLAKLTIRRVRFLKNLSALEYWPSLSKIVITCESLSTITLTPEHHQSSMLKTKNVNICVNHRQLYDDLVPIVQNVSFMQTT